MARGFESKDVEFQQSEAERPKSAKPALTPEERDDAGPPPHARARADAGRNRAAARAARRRTGGCSNRRSPRFVEQIRQTPSLEPDAQSPEPESSDASQHVPSRRAVSPSRRAWRAARATTAASRRPAPSGPPRPPITPGLRISSSSTAAAAHRRARRQPDGGTGSRARARRIRLSCRSVWQRRAASIKWSTPAFPATRPRAACRRLDWALEGDVRILIVALGAQRRLARTAGRTAERESRHASSSARRRAASRVDPGRHGSAAELGRRIHRRVSRRLSRAGEASITCALVPFLLEGVAGIDQLESARRHPSDGRRGPHRRGHGVEGARAGAAAAARAGRRAPPDHDSSCATSRRPSGAATSR